MRKLWIAAKEFHARVRVGLLLTQALSPDEAKAYTHMRYLRLYGASWQTVWRRLHNDEHLSPEVFSHGR